jgi:hypothetical protein
MSEHDDKKIGLIMSARLPATRAGHRKDLQLMQELGNSNRSLGCHRPAKIQVLILRDAAGGSTSAFCGDSAMARTLSPKRSQAASTQLSTASRPRSACSDWASCRPTATVLSRLLRPHPAADQPD